MSRVRIHQILARFAVERQALALMDHPNIAKVLEDEAEKGRQELRTYKSSANK